MTFSEGLFCGFCFLCLFGMYSCAKEMDTPEYKAREMVLKKECETPRLVSEINGVKLYVIKPDCYREVYFSQSGTHTTHTEHHGKSTSTYDDDVSNTEGDK